MKASIRRFHSPDVADLPGWHPPDPRDVGFLLQIMAGPADGPGGESFDVMVVTPRWLDRGLKESDPLLGRHHLIIDRYDWPAIERFVTGYVGAVDEPTWDAVATRLGRLGRWEFDNYRP